MESVKARARTALHTLFSWRPQWPLLLRTPEDPQGETDEAVVPLDENKDDHILSAKPPEKNLEQDGFEDASSHESDPRGTIQNH